jgi:hypothetical protein
VRLATQGSTKHFRNSTNFELQLQVLKYLQVYSILGGKSPSRKKILKEKVSSLSVAITFYTNSYAAVADCRS